MNPYEDRRAGGRQAHNPGMGRPADGRALASVPEVVYQPEILPLAVRGTCTASSELVKSGYVRIGDGSRTGLVLFVLNATPGVVGLPGRTVKIRAASAAEWSSLAATVAQANGAAVPFLPEGRGRKAFSFAKSAGKWFFHRVEVYAKPEAIARKPRPNRGTEPTSSRLVPGPDAEKNGGFDGRA